MPMEEKMKKPKLFNYILLIELDKSVQFNCINLQFKLHCLKTYCLSEKSFYGQYFTLPKARAFKFQSVDY